MEENMKDNLRTKAMLNFALFLLPKAGQNVSSIYPASKALILIRNDSLTSEESKAKKSFMNISYAEQVISI